MAPHLDAADTLAEQPEPVDACRPACRGRSASAPPRRRELPLAEAQEVGDVRDEAARGPACARVAARRRVRRRSRRASGSSNDVDSRPGGRRTRRRARPRTTSPPRSAARCPRASSRCSRTTSTARRRRSGARRELGDDARRARRRRRRTGRGRRQLAVVAARVGEQVPDAHVGRPDAGRRPRGRAARARAVAVNGFVIEATRKRSRRRSRRGRLGRRADRRRRQARAPPRRARRPRRPAETSNPARIRYPTGRPGLGRARLPSRRAEDLPGDTATERRSDAPHQGREAGARSEVRQARDGHGFAGGPDRDADASASTS